MASKYTANISGCSGHVVMGDNATIFSGAKHEGRHINQPEERASFTVKSVIPCQESEDTTQEFDELSDFPSIKLKTGYVLIINNQEFPQRSDYERQGSGVDVKNLNEMFDDHFGLRNVKIVRNLTSTQMLELLEETSEKDFSKYDCFVCVVLSHGSVSGVYGVDEQAIQVEALTSKFRRSACPSLEAKPKIFILQACRGSQRELLAVESDSEPVPLHCSGLPSDADFLICYASSPGYESYRNPELGSWFIRSIVDIFKRYAPTEHIMDMMLRVNHRVASYHSNLGHKQMPSEVCMLTKRVYFNVL